MPIPYQKGLTMDEFNERLKEADQKRDEESLKKIEQLDKEFPLEDRILAIEKMRADERLIQELTELDEYQSEALSIAAPVKLDEAAYIGVAGELVRIIEPNSETDPVAILMSFLTAFGSIVGEKPYFEIEADQHRMKLFCVLVGDTAKARKGTSWGHIRSLFSFMDQTWEEQITTGLNSGEGFIWEVRDPIIKKDKNGNEVITDEGVKDKRVLIIEPEFASTLKILGREGNTLSPNIRNAWDTGRLRSMTKNAPARTSHSHISIIAHITVDELLKDLDEVETTNGFGNRFLWFYVQRSKILPYGGQRDVVALNELSTRLFETIKIASQIEKMEFDDETYKLWGPIYQEITKPKKGIVGTMFARNEPYVLRLACLYALLDQSSVIRLPHLEAAIAIIDYALASLEYIFQDGDPITESIIGFLKDSPEGLSQTAIYNLFGRHKSSKDINNTLIGLQENGNVVAQKGSTMGRSTTIYTLNALNALFARPPQKTYLEILRTITKT